MSDITLDAANTLRDIFLTNGGRIPKRVMANAAGRLSYTYGWAIHEARAVLVYEEYAVHDGDDWVWPSALPRTP